MNNSQPTNSPFRPFSGAAASAEEATDVPGVVVSPFSVVDGIMIQENSSSNFPGVVLAPPGAVEGGGDGKNASEAGDTPVFPLGIQEGADSFSGQAPTGFLSSGLVPSFSSVEDVEAALAEVQNESVLPLVPKEFIEHGRAFLCALKTAELSGRVAVQWRSNSHIMFKASTTNPRALQCASDALKGNRDFMLAVITQNINTAQFASPALRKDRDFMLAAVTLDGLSLYLADEELKHDSTLVLTALLQNRDALYLASEGLQTNPWFCQIAALQDDFWKKDGRIKARIEAFIASQSGGGAAAFQGVYIPDSQNATRLCLQDWRHLKFSPAAVRYNRGFVLDVLREQGISLEQAILYFSAAGPNRDILLASFLFDELFIEVNKKVPMRTLLLADSSGKRDAKNKKRSSFSGDVARYIYKEILMGNPPVWNWRP